MARFDRIPKQRDRQPAAGPWRYGAIPVLGLTGTIGAGKSLVASRCAERGALVLDADAIGHALLDQRPARDQVVARFGTGVLRPGTDDGSPPAIDRRALGALVFANPAALRALENILHPKMVRTFEKAIDRAVRRGKATAVVLDAAVLLEKGWDGLCDRVVCVDAPREQRITRLSSQRGWTEADLEARERAQWTVEAKRGRADFTIDNSGAAADLAAAVERLWTAIQQSRPRVGRRPARPQPHQTGGGPDERPAAAAAPRRPGARRKSSRERSRP